MPGGVSTGTSIIAVEFDGGVVLGADSRTSTGASRATRACHLNPPPPSPLAWHDPVLPPLANVSVLLTPLFYRLPPRPPRSLAPCTHTHPFIRHAGTYVANRVSDKLTEVHDRIYCCRSGSAADTQAVSDYVRFYLDQHAMQVDRLPRVSTASTLFQSITYPNKDKLQASIIVAGWDPIDGGSVYCLPLGGSMHRQKFAIGGSGSTYVYGLVDALFKPNMPKEECVTFVKKVLAHAMARDGSSGGVIRTVVIEEGGITRDFTPNTTLPCTSFLEPEFQPAQFVASGSSITVRDDAGAVAAK